MAEIIKYGIIRDEELFEYLEDEFNLRNIVNLENKSLVKIIKDSVEIKSDIVSEDEKEKGIRAYLNYGHSFGHVIENLCGYGEYLHGEAISIGMRIAGEIAFSKGLWKKEETTRQNNLIKRYGLPIEVPTLNKLDVIRILMGDKKVQEGKMRFILPNKIGKVSIYTDIVESDFLKYFC